MPYGRRLPTRLSRRHRPKSWSFPLTSGGPSGPANGPQMVGPGGFISGRGCRVFGKRTHKPNSVYAVIPLGAALPRALISDLPGGFGHCMEQPFGVGPAPRASLAPWLRLPSLFGLAPCGVYPASVITAGAVRSYRTFSPLPLRGAALWSESRCPGSFQGCPTQWRYVLCGTSRPRALKPASRTLSGTLPCGVRTFLSRQPLLAQGFPAATARSSCQHIVYREIGLSFAATVSSTRDRLRHHLL